MAAGRAAPRASPGSFAGIRDYAGGQGSGVVDKRLAEESLDKLDVDPHGLDQMDRKILSLIVNQFGGGPVGVKTIAVACSEESRTIEDIYEPFLIQCGFIKRTPRGRVATAKAYQHLKMRLDAGDGSL